jgi:hypothetical protein
LNARYTLNHKSKTTFGDLSEDLQDEYLKWLLNASYDDIFNIYDERDYYQYIEYKRFQENLKFETHPHIKTITGCGKRHCHFVLFEITEDALSSFKLKVIELLKIKYSDKYIDICLKVVPIFFNEGWKAYINKGNVIQDMEDELAELNKAELQIPKIEID